MDSKTRKIQAVRAINDYHAEHGFAPTLRELRDLLGLRSVSYTHRLIKELVKEGVVSVQPGRSARTLRVIGEPEERERQG